MKITLNNLRRIISEEMNRLEEKEARITAWDPESLEGEFTAVGDRPGEPEGEFTAPFTGVPHKGTLRPKISGETAEELGYEGTRSPNIQLQRQLKDALVDLMVDVEPAGPSGRPTKGSVIADSLTVLADKYPDDPDVQRVIQTILSVKMGFDVPYSLAAEEEVVEVD